MRNREGRGASSRDKSPDASLRASSLRRDSLQGLKALASPTRLQVLEWLKNPAAHFPAQTDGDLVVDGVCSDFIRDKLGAAASTTSRHLSLLVDAGFLTATRRKGWTFYRRNDAAIAAFARGLRDNL
jgi:DNA-binding transcriptional ArsR family regulator